MSRIERGAVHDGPGLRTVVYLKGCPLRCLWCHSPETQSPAPELLLFRERCIGCRTCLQHCPTGAAGMADGACSIDRRKCTVCGGCAAACPTEARLLCGRRLTADETVDEVLRDRAFFDQSGGGVTLSGGEPLLQPSFALAVLDRCRAERIHTAVETCGLVRRDVLLEAATRTDLFLFDLKAVDDDRHRAMTAVSNSAILTNLEALAGAHPNVVIRFPLVPELNDDDATVCGLGSLLTRLGLNRIDVLPYHRAGIAKYERLDRRYRLTDLTPPEAACIDHAVARLRGYGMIVTAGGAV